MKGSALCEVCGNEVPAQEVRCPYCGAKRNSARHQAEGRVFRIVNLEKGMPPVRDALQRMHNEITTARLLGERLLVFIHGYGSSGRGGAIKDEVRRQLEYLFEKKEINDFIPGVDCDRRAKHFRQLLRRFPVLGKLVRKPNPGITVVVI